MSDRQYCPTCGVQRTGPTCGNCGYDFVEAAVMPAVARSRRRSLVSVAVGIIVLVLLAVVGLAALGADVPFALT